MLLKNIISDSIIRPCFRFRVSLDEIRDLFRSFTMFLNRLYSISIMVVKIL